MRAALVLILLICCLPVRSWPITDRCENNLHQPRLGIGVLGRTFLGFPVLGLGSYVGAHHHDVIQKMKERHFIVRLDWLGELRYTISRAGVQIHEVNETSGYFVHGAPDLPMDNDGRRIPYKWRSRRFVLHTYDPNSPHLDQTLNAISGNVRHELANVLQKFSSLLSVLASERIPPETKMELLRGFRDAPDENGNLIEWIIESLIRERAITEFEVQEILLALRLIANSSLSTYLMNPNFEIRADQEISILSQAVAGQGRFNRVAIVADYWPF